jgi:excisionase family DNA binding protein
MSNHDDTWQHLTVSEAAERLGVSTATVRRMVRAGKLEGNTVLRPQGKTYVVRLPRQASPPADQVADTDHVPGGMSRGNVAAQEAMAAWPTSVLTPILAPIVAELTASRLANEQKAETIGRLTVEPAPEASPASWRPWWFWLVLLAPILVTAVIVVLVLVVPR